MKPKPPCPTCADASRVKTQGGGSKKLYRYTCEKSDCHTEWQQIPPHKLEGEIAKIILKTTGRRANQYKCGICGAKKKGHKCKVAEEDGDGDDSAMATLSVVAVGEGQSVLPAVSVHGTGFASMSFAVPLSDAEKRGTLPLLHFWRETVTSARSTPPNSVFR